MMTVRVELTERLPRSRARFFSHSISLVLLDARGDILARADQDRSRPAGAANSGSGLAQLIEHGLAYAH